MRARLTHLLVLLFALLGVGGGAAATRQHSETKHTQLLPSSVLPKVAAPIANSVRIQLHRGSSAKRAMGPQPLVAILASHGLIAPCFALDAELSANLVTALPRAPSHLWSARAPPPWYVHN